MFGLDNPAVLQALHLFLEGGANVDLPATFERPYLLHRAKHTFRNWMPTILDVVYFQDAKLYSFLVDHSVKFKVEPTRSGIHHSASKGIEPLRMYLLSCISNTPAEQDALVDIVLTEEFLRGGDSNFDVICNLLDYNLGFQASRFDLNTSAMLFCIIEKAKQQGMHPAVPQIVKTLTQSGAIIVDETIRAAVDRKGTTFLQLLSRYGADFKNQGALALCSAAQFGNYSAVNWLLDKGVDVNTTLQADLIEQENGEQVKITIIAHASIFGPHGREYAKIFDHKIWRHEEMPTIGYDMFEYLVYRGAKLRANPTDTSPRQLLHLIIGIGAGEDNWESFFAKIKLILNTEPLRDDESRVDRCPLEACFWGPFFWSSLTTLPQKLLILDYLLKCGISVRQRCVLPYLLLLGAPRSEIEKMLNSGADLNAHCGRWWRSPDLGVFREHRQRTPIEAAVEAGSLDWVRTLIERGADANSPAKGFGGRTALQAACEAECGSPEDRANNINLIKLLIANGADVNAPPASGCGVTAFQCAAAKGNFEVALLLLDNGADINASPSNGGFCALDGAVWGGRTDMVQFLLNIGAVSYPKGESGYREAIRSSRNGAITDLIRQYALKGGKSGEELSADWFDNFKADDTDEASDAEMENQPSWEDWLPL
ncbi:hypothetical protein E0Z10_g7648 [Xylaria hypoxylon]|uniref:Uncharacterized protein n=1 Tax=Xylaria hypoxylon TaxID=37992 RepID=A0A4Z0YUG8_9PEZI|nr:hypothetical protein E0Z10_g7648 [Xylaria hypoxylon]